MKEDKTKVCWSCGLAAMKKAGDYYQCSRCQATYTKLHSCGRSCLIEELNPVTGVIQGRPANTRDEE